MKGDIKKALMRDLGIQKASHKWQQKINGSEFEKVSKQCLAYSISATLLYSNGKSGVPVNVRTVKSPIRPVKNKKKEPI